jgi:hypothetical protein
VIDPAKWYGWEYQPGRMLRETSRSVSGGALRLTAKGYTDPLTPMDELEGLNYLLLVNDTQVKGFKATLRLKKVRFANCDEMNPCNADIRIKATFFNAGTPTPGSYKDDINAMIYLRTYSNRPGTVDIRGIVDRCLDDYCAGSEPLFDQILDTISILKPITLGVEWDKANQRLAILYGIRKGVYSYRGILSDQNVGNTAKDLNARLIIPNTNSQTRSMAYVDALIQNVYLKY